MPTSEIEQFLTILVREVRDNAIEDSDGAVNGPRVKALAEAHGSLSHVLIPDCVDATLFFLLRAIDEGTLRIAFIAEDGKTVNLNEAGLGELAGWYAGEWRETHSKERFFR